MAARKKKPGVKLEQMQADLATISSVRRRFQ
jgi:hypothetical protein